MPEPSTFVVQKKTKCPDCVQGISTRFVDATREVSDGIVPLNALGIALDKQSDALCPYCANGYRYENVDLADALVALTDGE